MVKDFEIVNHTADIGIKAYGADMEESFINAARGLFSLITDLDEVEVETQFDIEINSSDEESLLVAWLNELIFLFDTENILFKEFQIVKLDSKSLIARAYGQKVDTSRHELKREVKAATYHMLEIDKSDGCQVQVLFDI